VGWGGEGKAGERKEGRGGRRREDTTGYEGLAPKGKSCLYTHENN